MTVYLDAGTSTLEIVPYIKALSGMTVVTNDFGVVQALMEAPQVTVIHTGGQLDHSNHSCVGGLAPAATDGIRKQCVELLLSDGQPA
ncbi:hypothetical protein LOY64_19655 [Pseudomonas corrugata]|nr:hypothetical protein [Pseudomonas corrugata]UZD98367.1 hypothetical protein LOY64_19655 [Pseudomonas corrugata]UZE09012.1 hypothetical protein LOY65_17035 [Pseudomonas corrugata]